MTTIVERIRQIIEHKRFSERFFCMEIGVANGFLNKVKDVGSDKLNKILYKYPEINPVWLLTGKESMLIANNNQSDPRNISNSLSVSNGIPLVAETELRKFWNEEFSIQETAIKARYVVPKFKYRAIDFMVEVSDNGMFPKYSSGDILACAVIKEETFIQWNKPYVIVTKGQGILIKRIKKSVDEKTLLVISDNESYEPFEIPKSEIIGIAIIIGSIKLE